MTLLGRDTRVARLQQHQVLDQKCAADEQREGEGDLHHDEAIAELTSAGGGPQVSLTNGGGQCFRSHPEERPYSAKQPDERRDSQR